MCAGSLVTLSGGFHERACPARFRPFSRFAGGWSATCDTTSKSSVTDPVDPGAGGITSGADDGPPGDPATVAAQ